MKNDSAVKFLGIQVDSNLNWKAHCSGLISKLNSISFLFRTLKPVLTTQQLLNLYNAQVESRIRYGICLWGWSTLSKSVFVSQKRIIRCIAGVASTFSCRNLFKKYSILTLYDLFVFEVAVYAFRNKNKFSRNDAIHQHDTRIKENLHVPYCRLNVTKKSPNYLGPRIFNMLPANITTSKTLSQFKGLLKSYLLTKSLYSLDEFF